MLINNTPVFTDLSDILYELKRQLESNGIKLLRDIKSTPDNMMITCPYHKGGQEHKPSAGIKKLDGTFHCFTCGETHSLPEVISYCFGHYDDVVGAFGWAWLLKNFVTVGVEERKTVDLDFSRSYIGKSVVQYVPDSELDKYRVYHPYMWKRKLTPEVVELFDIGYDEEAKALTFPVRDITGGCLFIARRSVVTKFFNYPSNVNKPIYGLYELYSLDKFPSEVIICESMLDALVFWTIGKYAVALNGLGTSLQIKELNSMPCRKFILCTDSDSAGMKARQSLRSKLTRKLVSEYMLPKGVKDANDCTEEELKNLQEIF